VLIVLPPSSPQDNRRKLADMPRPQLIQIVEAGVDGVDGFFYLEPKRAQVGRFWKPFTGQGCDLRQNRLSLFGGEVCGERTDVARCVGLGLWYLDGLYLHLPPGTFKQRLQCLSPTRLQFRHSPIHRHGLELELAALGHNPL
jgi:hypothetical protein